MKRALEAVKPEPALNFWRLIYGNQMDIAVLEWCKIFGSDGEETHWKNIVPAAEHEQFRQRLIVSVGISAEQWSAYWQEMKLYRDNLVAHHIEGKRVANYPNLDIALQSSFAYYNFLIAELRSLGEHRYPDDLQNYCTAFGAQSLEIATTALASTASIKERVY